MSAIQLHLWDKIDEKEQLRLDLEKLRKEQNALRKGLFGRHAEMAKQILDLYEEIERLRNEISKMKMV